MCFSYNIVSKLDLCLAIRVVNRQRKMEVLSSDDSDDFQLPGSFDELVSLARSSVSTLRHLHYPNRKERVFTFFHEGGVSDFNLILPGFHKKE